MPLSPLSLSLSLSLSLVSLLATPSAADPSDTPATSLLDLYKFQPSTYFGPDASAPVREALAASFVSPTEDPSPQKWDLWHTQTVPPPSALEGLTPAHRVNHVPGSQALTKKASLASLVRPLEERFPGEFSFLPDDTLVLPEDWERLGTLLQEEAKLERPWFSRRKAPAFGGFEDFGGDSPMPEDSAASPAALPEEPHWVVKTHGHRGVEVVNNPQIFAGLRDDKTKFVMQRYVPAHLVDGHKYDVGFYVLVTSAAPLRAYVFDDVLLRFCPSPYPADMAGFADKSAWVIPGAGYKTARDMPSLRALADEMRRNGGPSLGGGAGGLFEDDTTTGSGAAAASSAKDGNKTAFEPTNLDLLREHLASTAVAYGEDGAVVIARAHDRIRKALLAAAPSMAAGARGQRNFFELFRFDFLVGGTDLMPRLVEVNMSPSLGGEEDAALKRRLVDETLRLAGVSVLYKESAHETIRRLRDEVVLRGASRAHCAADVCKTCPLDGRCALCDRCVGSVGDEYALHEMLLEHHRRGAGYRLVYPTADQVLRTEVARPGALVLDPGAAAPDDRMGDPDGDRVHEGGGGGEGGGEGGAGANAAAAAMMAAAVAEAEPTPFSYLSYVPFLAWASRDVRDASMRSALQAQVVAERLRKKKDEAEAAASPASSVHAQHFATFSDTTHLVDASDALPDHRGSAGPSPGMPAGPAHPDPTDPDGVNHQPFRLDADGNRYTQPRAMGGGLGDMMGGGGMDWPGMDMDPDGQGWEGYAALAGFGDGDDAPDLPEDFVGPDGKAPGQHINLGEPLQDPFDPDADMDDQGRLLGGGGGGGGRRALLGSRWEADPTAAWEGDGGGDADDAGSAAAAAAVTDEKQLDDLIESLLSGANEARAKLTRERREEKERREAAGRDGEENPAAAAAGVPPDVLERVREVWGAVQQRRQTMQDDFNAAWGAVPPAPAGASRKDALARWARDMLDRGEVPEGLTEEQMRDIVEGARGDVDFDDDVDFAPDNDFDADADSEFADPNMMDGTNLDAAGSGKVEDRAFYMRSEAPPHNYGRSAAVLVFFVVAAYAVVSFLNGRRQRDLRAGDQEDLGGAPGGASAGGAGAVRKRFVSNV